MFIEIQFLDEHNNLVKTFFCKRPLTQEQIHNFERDIQYLLPVDYLFIPIDSPFND
jgi:hypothetical protein